MNYAEISAPEDAEKPPSQYGAVTAAAILPELFPSRATRDVFPVNPKAELFRRMFWPDASPTEWNDWRWQLKNRLVTLKDFERVFSLSDDEKDMLRSGRGQLPVAVTPYYASLCLGEDSHPLRQTFVPSMAECEREGQENDDPLAEEHDSPVPGLVHRYPDRVLFMTTDFCSVYCRYCTRSRRVGRTDTNRISRASWDAAIEYIAKNSQIRDVVVSGGDPLTMSNSALEGLLSRLRAIPHVEVIRIGTKVPMVLPQRITRELVRILKRFHPLYVSVHCTHPDELTPEASVALGRLADAGIVLGSQTVLLAGVNDQEETVARLCKGLMKNRVRPYYLYECDQVAGTAHFRTPVSRGIELISSLRGHTSGYAVPQFVVDLPGGGGKVPLLPGYFKGREGDNLVFENYEGGRFLFHEPASSAEELPCA